MIHKLAQWISLEHRQVRKQDRNQMLYVTAPLALIRPRSYGVSFFFFQAEDGIRDYKVTGVQTCALPIYRSSARLRLFTLWQPCARWRHQRHYQARRRPNAWRISRRRWRSRHDSQRAWDGRSEERRVGKEGRSRWSPYH